MTDGAYGTGLATVTPSGTVLDVWYPEPALLMSGRLAEQPDLRLAERTDAAAGAVGPILLGGHGRVGPGARLALGGRR